MIRLKYTFIILFFASCKYISDAHKEHNRSNEVELNLIDRLGTIVFDCPDKYDTSFSWTYFSDCNTCHDQKYRYQSKQAAIVKETGWAWPVSADQMDRFTITHRLNISIFSNDTSKNLAIHENFKENLMYIKSPMRMISDTIYKINDRYFSIFTLESVDSVLKKEVLAVTNIKGNDITFDCEMISKRNDTVGSSFISNSINLINSIIIKDRK